MRRKAYIFALLTLPLLLAFAACREDELVVPTSPSSFTTAGFFSE